jgi:hypothetical protein
MQHPPSFVQQPSIGHFMGECMLEGVLEVGEETGLVAELGGLESTVTCLRSPSRAAFEVRIFSARCLGVYCLSQGQE